jgi:hypothetical protein
MKELEGMRPGPVISDHSPENSSLQSKRRMSQIKSSAKNGQTVRHSIISVSPRPFRESWTCAVCEQVHESLNGYLRLGAFVASDRNFLIVRRFNHLQARLLLQVQDELRKFEAQLNAMDKGALLACKSLQFREIDDDLLGRRKSLLREIEYPTAYF